MKKIFFYPLYLRCDEFFFAGCGYDNLQTR